MKKIFTLIVITLSFSGFAQTPTCTLDPIFVASNKTGIWPDSATNFVQGTVGQPYLQNITVKVPLDSIANPLSVCFKRVELSSPTGFTNLNLPAGLNLYAGTNVTLTAGVYKYPGNDNTCSIISGTPTTPGTYTLQFKVQPYLTPKIGSCPTPVNPTQGSALVAPSILTYYIIKINAAAGIKEEVNSGSLNVSNSPNPFSGKTQIKFNVKDEAQAKISVYNVLGNKIFSDAFKTNYGENSYELNASNWSNGIYLYTIQYKNYTETKRLVLSNTN